MIYLKWTLLILYLSISANCLADQSKNPCHSPFSLLSIVDHPTTAFSQCTPPAGKVIVEMDYQYQKLQIPGHKQNYPDLEVRYGITNETEVLSILPNVIQYSSFIRPGTTAVTLGIKHQFAYTDKFVFTANALFLPPSGSDNFGVNKLNLLVNGIFNYSFTRKFNVTWLLGVSSLTTAPVAGDKRFTSFNPDLVLTYAPNSWLNGFIEFYGESKVGPHAGSGYNVDGGFLYLFKPNIVLNILYEHRMSGHIGDFEQLIEAGASIYF